MIKFLKKTLSEKGFEKEREDLAFRTRRAVDKDRETDAAVKILSKDQ